MKFLCVDVQEYIILIFFILGYILTIFGCLFNFCLCLLFCRVKSLRQTFYGIFIIAVSIVDIFKLMTEYVVHILYFYIEHPYFVCSITWFLTMTSENLSYLFLCALGIERSLKVWVVDRRRAILIACLLIFSVFIHDHFFLFPPSCDNAFYRSYRSTYSLADLIFFQSIGLNNLILPVGIVLINILLIFGLKRRSHKRRRCLSALRHQNEWKERSVILYIFFSSIVFLILTTPVGILNAWSSIYNHRLATNNTILILDLLEILHHCSHFPILLMTSSMVRKKILHIIFHVNQ